MAEPQKEHPFVIAARELREIGTAAISLGPHLDLVLTAYESKPGQRAMRCMLTTGDYHKTTVRLSAEPILPDDEPDWTPEVVLAARGLYAAAMEGIENLVLARRVLDQLLPDDE